MLIEEFQKRTKVYKNQIKQEFKKWKSIICENQNLSGGFNSRLDTVEKTSKPEDIMIEIIQNEMEKVETEKKRTVSLICGMIQV